MKRHEFSRKTKVAAFQRAGGQCENCGVRIAPGNGPEYDHRIPCEMLGEGTLENCVVLCRNCHITKTNADMRTIVKARRVSDRHKGINKYKRKRKMGYQLFDGTPVNPNRRGA